MGNNHGPAKPYHEKNNHRRCRRSRPCFFDAHGRRSPAPQTLYSNPCKASNFGCLNMPEDKTELEKPTERIIELNEWFTPYVDYDNLPYNTLPGGIPYRGDSLIHKDQKTYIFI